MKVTRQQLEQLRRFYLEAKEQRKYSGSFLSFIRSTRQLLGGEGALIIKARNQFIVIETDGHSHT